MTGRPALTKAEIGTIVFYEIITVYPSVYYVLQSQRDAAGYANNKIHKESAKIDI